MRIVDAHVHLYPSEINGGPEAWALKHGEAHWAVLCTRRRKNGSPVQAFPSVDELLQDMDAAGVERVILQGWYWEKHDTCSLQNRFFARCIREHPDRLSAFAALNVNAGAAALDGELCRVREEGFSGFGELSPHSQGAALADPLWRHIFETAGNWHWPVNLHVTEEHSGHYPGKVSTPLGEFVELAEAFPQTLFILAHWGARLPLDPTWGERARRCRNLYYDAAASPLIYRHNLFREMAGAVGADRLLYGSDHPLNLYPRTDDQARLGAMVQELDQSGLIPDEQAAVAALNALRLLGKL